jgi:hypothetical protein
MGLKSVQHGGMVEYFTNPHLMASNPPPSASASSNRKSSQITFALFIVSCVLHLGVVLGIRHYQHPVTWENGGIANYMYEGKGFSSDFSLHGEPTSWQAPGYPVMLYLFWKAFGQTSTAYLLLSVAQCLAVASMVWPFGILSRRWFPDIPAWIAQALVVVAPLYLWYCTRIHHTAFVMAMHPWLLCAWLEWCRRGPLQAIGTGVLSGIAGLFQPVLLGVYGIIGVVLLAAALLKKDWKETSNLILAALFVVACLTPWTIRNYRVHGKFIFVKDSMGKEFWVGNNPHATGTAFVAGGTAEVTHVYPPKAFALVGKVPEIVVMDALKAEAWDYVKAHPGRTAELILHKILWFWTTPPKDLVRSSGEGEALTFRWVQLAYWTTFIAFGLLGIVTAKCPLKEYLAVLALFAVFYSGVYGMTHVGQARFRGEIEFVFLFGAAAGIHFLLSLLSRKAPRPAGA